MTETGITVTGRDLLEIKYKLGFRTADIRIGLDETAREGVRIVVESNEGPQTFLKVKQAVTHVAGLLMAHEMKLIARKRNASTKKRVGKPRILRPKKERRKRNGFRNPERRGR